MDNAEAWNEEQVIRFAWNSANQAIDQQDAYPSLEDAIESYEGNMLGTVNQNGAQKFHHVALRVYQETIAMLLAA